MRVRVADAPRSSTPPVSDAALTEKCCVARSHSYTKVQCGLNDFAWPV